jgi:hypothetical protein
MHSMTMSDEPTSERPNAPGSARVRLAALSRDTALGVPGVAATDPGPTGLFATVDSAHRVDGVRCIATGEGIYEVSLRLRCELVPLRSAAGTVRSAVWRAAATAGMALSEVNVLVSDVVEPQWAR